MEAVVPGLGGETEQVVTTSLVAPHVGSGTLMVYATPALAALIEETCRKIIEPLLPESYTTVGVEIHLRHLAPTPVGRTVRVRAEVVAVAEPAFVRRRHAPGRWYETDRQFPVA
ncbi:MAG TPA: hotdog domain-containing protein [Anaerolineales bacterium]|nr:hotdog domain-containing protein [Anaerolineales bacterium]